MEEEVFDSLEKVWGALLSRQTERVRKVFRLLDKESQIEAYRHLQKMATEEGWHIEQQLSASAALKALEREIEKKNFKK